MIRQYEFHDEVHYVVRLDDGRPLAVPAWMTRPEAAGTRIVSAARLPVGVLLELLRVTEASLSSRVQLDRASRISYHDVKRTIRSTRASGAR